MNEDVLLKFLGKGLLDVGGDDGRLEKLKSTVKDLSAELQKAPHKSAAFSLVAFDPNISAADPVIVVAMTALAKRWPTYVNTFAATPLAVLRALLLDAVVSAANEDERIAVAFVMSARNALPFAEPGGESEVWSEVVGSLEKLVDGRAEAEWATPLEIDVPAIDFQPPAVVPFESEGVDVDEEALTVSLQAAAGPQSQNTATKGNPHWAGNGQQNWVYEFGTRAAKAIAEAVNTAVEGSAVGPIDLSAPLTELAKAVSSHTEATLRAVSAANAGLQRRTNLLWWKESLFSPSARVSYRDIPRSGAVALMAFDLHKAVPMFSPASVGAVLNEAVMSMPDATSESQWTIRELLTELCESERLGPLREASAELFNGTAGRAPLLTFAGHQESPRLLDDAKFLARTGLPHDTLLSAGVWAMWIFRELQAARATAAPAGAKRRGRRS